MFILCEFVSVCARASLYVSIQLDVLLTRKYINHSVSTCHKLSVSASFHFLLLNSSLALTKTCSLCHIRRSMLAHLGVCDMPRQPLSMSFSQLHWHLIYCCDMARMCYVAPVRIPHVNCKLRVESTFEAGNGKKRSALNLYVFVFVCNRMNGNLNGYRERVSERANERTNERTTDRPTEMRWEGKTKGEIECKGEKERDHLMWKLIKFIVFGIHDIVQYTHSR